MSSTNFLDSLKIKPLVTNENENGIKIIIPKQPVIEGTENKKTTKILRELVDEGTRAIDIANKIKEQRLTGVKKSIKPQLIEKELISTTDSPETYIESIKPPRKKTLDNERPRSEKKKTSVFQNIPTRCEHHPYSPVLVSETQGIHRPGKGPLYPSGRRTISHQRCQAHA